MKLQSHWRQLFVSSTGIGMAVATASALIGCGLIQGMQDNECGGDGLLTYEGELAAPGDVCGPCDNDILQCHEGGLNCSAQTPCEAPAELTADSAVDHVTLSWQHVDGAVEYVLYRDGDEMEVVSVDSNTAVGESIQYEDDRAEPGRPGPPEAVEVDDDGDSGDVELVWEPPEGGLITEHDYRLVAVHENVEEPESQPVDVIAGRMAPEADGYEYRRIIGEETTDWSNIDYGTTPDGALFSQFDTDELQWPQVQIGGLEVAGVDDGWNVRLQLEDVYAQAPETRYEVRAVATVDDEEMAGESNAVSWYPPVDEFVVQWSRAVSGGDDVDDEEFDLIGSDSAVAEMTGDEQYRFGPGQTLTFEHEFPESPAEINYRAEVWLERYEETSSARVKESGYRSQPAVFSGASDATTRRIRPNGAEQWSVEPGEDEIWAVAAEPQGHVYLSASTPQNGGDFAETLYKFDGEQNDEKWAFSDLDDRIEDLAVCASGFLIAAGQGGDVYRFDGDSPTDFDRWTGGEMNHLGVAVDDECNVFVNSDDGYVRRIDFEDEPSVKWEVYVGPESGAENLDIFHAPVALDSNGRIHFATEENAIGVIDNDGTLLVRHEVPLEDAQNHFGGTFTDLVVDDRDRVYVSRYQVTNRSDGYDNIPLPAYQGYLYAFAYDDIESAPEQLAQVHHDSSDDFYHSATITSVAVDPFGTVYYATRNPSERIYALPSVDAVVEDGESWTEPVWEFDGHATTPNPDPGEADPNTDAPEDCNTSGVSCVNIHHIAVNPGEYSAFPDAWKEVQNRVDD